MRLRVLAERPWLIAAAAAAVVGVPVAGATVMAGGGNREESSRADGKRPAAEDPIDRLIARSRSQREAVEPSVGVPSGVVVEAGGASDSPASPRGAKDDDGSVSPGAPTDAEIKRELAALKAIERQQARVQRALAASGAPIRAGSGRFIWPINGSFTSPFGPRWGRLHAGIDLAAPTGTPIRAADTGQVAIASAYGGYGNYTCIRHTRRLTTCYGHQSQIGVRVGQVVTQGQVIGLVGSTGHSTGPHLHFEVRIGGKPVDPMAYL